MKTQKCFSFFTIAVLLLICSALSATTYYVDATDGDDSKSGTSEANAWQNLSKVNSTTFSAGDSILFQCGETWSGQLWPKGSGTSGSVITIDKYGTGDLPLIQGPGGTTAPAVFLYCQEYWEINNLEITHYDGSDNTIKRVGVFIQAEDVNMPGGADVLHHIYLKGLNIHNINGLTTSKQSGGIKYACSGPGTADTKIWFDDILIDDCYVYDVNRTGIVFWSDWSTRTKTDETLYAPWTNVVIQNNTIENTYSNGMIIRMSDSPLLEYNVFVNCADGEGSGNAMFFFNCDNALAQYNEGYGTVFNTGDLDAAAFDSDYQCKDTIFQYNYSHDNELGGIVAVCSNVSSKFNDGTIIRYNIFEDNDRQTFRNTGGTTNTKFYNNTMYLGSGLSNNLIFYQKSWSGVYPDGTGFFNNIIYNLSSSASYDFGSATNTEFDSNLFYGNHPGTEPSDANKITSDPSFVSPGSGGIGMDSVDGYKLNTGSPCIDAGIWLDDRNGGYDYWANTIAHNGTPDRGAHEWDDGDANDNTAPTPSTMTWASEPSAVSGSAIEMTATTATDSDGYAVEYYFNNVTVSGHDSNWQAGTYYKDTGLDVDTTYTYQVKARDTSVNFNENTYSTQKAATTLPPATPTIFEKFDSDPTSNGWVDAGAGSTTFDYNSAGYLDVVILRERRDPATYHKMLAQVFDETQEFWWEMDMEPVSASSDYPIALFGVFDYNTTGHKNNIVADRFSYRQFEGSSRGNRHDIYGWATDATVNSGNGSPTEPGISYGDNIRAKGHYWYESGVGGQAIVTVYEIDTDGSTGAQIMTTGTVEVIDSGDELSFDMFGLGNRTDGGNVGDNKFKVDNLYFSITGENTNPVDPNFDDSGGPPCTPTDMHVESIVCETFSVGGGNKKGRATVTILDDCGNPLQYADVDGTFTGDYDESVTNITTNASGVAVLETVGTAKGGISFTFCVDDVTHATLTYDSNDNTETCDTN